MAIHELHYSDRGLYHGRAPTFILALHWSRDEDHLGKVETCVSQLDYMQQPGTEARFWSAVAREAALRLEEQVRRGESRTTWSIDAWPVVVDPRRAARRACSEEDLPRLAPGVLVHRFDAD